LQRLRGHVEHGDVHKMFFFDFFNIFKYIKNEFQIKGAYAPESKKSEPFYLHSMMEAHNKHFLTFLESNLIHSYITSASKCNKPWNGGST
jgi:hypothetical protein